MTSTRLENPRVALADSQVSKQERVTGQGRTVQKTDRPPLRQEHFTFHLTIRAGPRAGKMWGG